VWVVGIHIREVIREYSIVFQQNVKVEQPYDTLITQLDVLQGL
jgi:hypothetical protein